MGGSNHCRSGHAYCHTLGPIGESAVRWSKLRQPASDELSARRAFRHTLEEWPLTVDTESGATLRDLVARTTTWPAVGRFAGGCDRDGADEDV
jgi:hypothetical protein